MYGGSRSPRARRGAAGSTFRPGDRNDEADHLLDLGHRPHGDGRRRHAGLRGQGRLDLAQLDAETADLHLAVRPAEAMDGPPGSIRPRSPVR